jgi:hypothetical protein
MSQNNMAAWRQIGNPTVPRYPPAPFLSFSAVRRGDDSLAGADHTEAERFVAFSVEGSQCRGQTDGDIPLPTTLPPIPPRPRRAPDKRSPARIIFDVVFNTALVVSALMLTFIVLVRQEQHAFGQPQRPAQTVEQIEPAAQNWDTTGKTVITPPSN